MSKRSGNPGHGPKPVKKLRGHATVTLAKLLDSKTNLERQDIKQAVDVLVDAMPGLLFDALNVSHVPEDLLMTGVASFCSENTKCGPGMQCADAHGCKEHSTPGDDGCPVFTCKDIHHCSQSSISPLELWETPVWEVFTQDMLTYFINPQNYTKQTRLLLIPPGQ